MKQNKAEKNMKCTMKFVSALKKNKEIIDAAGDSYYVSSQLKKGHCSKVQSLMGTSHGGKSLRQLVTWHLQSSSRVR